LADDHAVVRKGIREFLEEDGQILVLAEAANGGDAVRLVAEQQPAVAILDIQMPGMTGIEATRIIKAGHPQVKVLILTAYDDDPYVFALLRAGADGYVLKNADSADLVRAVKAVAAGGRVLDPSIASKVVAQATSGRPAGAQGQIEPLSERELDVLRLAGKGYTNKAIGHELNISDRTVQGHLATIYGKLGVASRTEAVTKALKLGWIVLES
jgi:DNA-binding NarL/FixJ family response regulator